MAGGHLATHRRRSRRAIDDRFVGSLLTLGFRDRWSSTEVVECRTLDVSGRGSRRREADARGPACDTGSNPQRGLRPWGTWISAASFEPPEVAPLPESSVTRLFLECSGPRRRAIAVHPEIWLCTSSGIPQQRRGIANARKWPPRRRPGSWASVVVKCQTAPPARPRRWTRQESHSGLRLGSGRWHAMRNDPWEDPR